MSLDNRNKGQSTGGTIILLHLPWYLVSHSLLHYFSDFIFQRSLCLYTICICSILHPYLLELFKTLRSRRGFNREKACGPEHCPSWRESTRGVRAGIAPFLGLWPLLPISDPYSELCLRFWEQSLLLITPSMSLEFSLHCLYSCNAYIENMPAPVQLKKTPKKLLPGFKIWVTAPSSSSALADSRAPALGQMRRVTVELCGGSWSRGGVNSQSLLVGVRNKTNGINALKPVFIYFIFNQFPVYFCGNLPSWVWFSGAQQCGFSKVLSACLLGAAAAELEGCCREGVPRRSGWWGRQGLLLWDYSPKQRW